MNVESARGIADNKKLFADPSINRLITDRSTFLDINPQWGFNGKLNAEQSTNQRTFKYESEEIEELDRRYFKKLDEVKRYSEDYFRNKNINNKNASNASKDILKFINS